MFGSFGITIGLFWFAWVSRASVHWMVPIIAAIPFAWGNLSIFVCGSLTCLTCSMHLDSSVEG
jgi:hypothetical protein